MHPLKTFACAAGLLASAGLNAQTLGNTSTYAGLTWGFSSSAAGLPACSQLVLDATGDPAHSDNYITYGQVVCPALGGNYASSGNAYFDSSGAFHMKIGIGVTYQMVCDNLSGVSLSGTCPIYDNNGVQAGSAFISFL